MATATWTPVLCVRYDGERLNEYTASRPDTRSRCASQRTGTPGRGYGHLQFDRLFAETREGAIQTFIAQQQEKLGNARAEMEVAQLMLRRGETLRAKERVEA